MTRMHWLLLAAVALALGITSLWPAHVDHAANAASAAQGAHPAPPAARAAPGARSAARHPAAPRVLAWEDLVPPNYNPEDVLGDTSQLAGLQDSDPRAKALLARLRKAYDEAPVVASLNGAFVKMPGYAVPLDQANGRTFSFLLVPFYGACIHEPPPPANQIVYVTVPGGTVIAHAFDVVWATGVMSATRAGTRLATAGYGLRASKVEPYKAEDDPNA